MMDLRSHIRSRYSVTLRSHTAGEEPAAHIACMVGMIHILAFGREIYRCGSACENTRLSFAQPGLNRSTVGDSRMDVAQIARGSRPGDQHAPLSIDKPSLADVAAVTPNQAWP
jgi:hypothetical protein